jgi:hypothetical protein
MTTQAMIFHPCQPDRRMPVIVTAVWQHQQHQQQQKKKNSYRHSRNDSNNSRILLHHISTNNTGRVACAFIASIRRTLPVARSENRHQLYALVGRSKVSKQPSPDKARANVLHFSAKRTCS